MEVTASVKAARGHVPSRRRGKMALEICLAVVLWFARLPDRSYRCDSSPQGSRGFYVRAEHASLPPHASDMLTTHRPGNWWSGTCTPHDSPPRRLLQCSRDCSLVTWLSNSGRSTTRPRRLDLIPGHSGYRRIFRLYAQGKFRSRCETTNVVLPRTWRDKRLFVHARVEFAVNSICVINLSRVAPLHSFWADRPGYDRFCDGPSAAPAPLDLACHHSKPVLNENIDEPTAHK